MDLPQIIEGGRYSDERGNLFFNNNFDASVIRRIYIIENNDLDFVRGWTGHKIEQRWFSVVKGSFIIKLIQPDDWESPSNTLKIMEFEITSDRLDILHMPQGFASAIQAKEKDSKLLVMVDHALGEVNDEHRFPADYFKKI
ncbi:MAG: sugar epimerase [Chryseobacterium sp. 36-9]|nr:MAG: sugar epimerase [Chryseobacterium sp. 36-9]